MAVEVLLLAIPVTDPPVPEETSCLTVLESTVTKVAVFPYCQCDTGNRVVPEIL